MVLSFFKDDLNGFLKNWAFWLCLIIVLAILLTLLFLYFVPAYKKAHPQKKAPIFNPGEWTECLGGKENIVSLSVTLSRLTVNVKDVSLINQEKLKSLGVKHLLLMSDKVILITEEDATKIKEEIAKTL